MASWLPCSRTVLYLLHNLSINSRKYAGKIALRRESVDKRFLCTSSEGIIFDREAKRIQRNRAAQLDDYNVCQYVKDEIAYRVADKVFDLTKFNDICIDIGCGSGHIAMNLIKVILNLINRLIIFANSVC
ncbi:unnamed protein product [Onchocerca flexuosa]|uniref:DOT1 domain-containing protein n=1 Tax=Onchocerca flexuosa TaxID=387005 RepID=A0A183HK06_9BILA|nr:unnamed protein product [Onchocerca flexuosa]